MLPGPPLIGITGRRMEAATAFPQDAAMLGSLTLDAHISAYARRVAEAGGLPVQLAYEADPVALADRLDGLVLSGGPDVDPALYGGAPEGARGVDPVRDRFELALLDEALVRGIPILGVCRGLQLINVARGGTLVPDVEELDARGHFSRSRAFTEHAHPLEVEPGTLAARLYPAPHAVNSSHRQAVAVPGRDVVIGGRSPDGVVEAIELADAVVLAVQWHPECLVETDPSFPWLVGEARRAMARAVAGAATGA